MVDIPVVRVTQVSQVQVVAEFFEFPQLQFVEEHVVFPVAVQVSQTSLSLLGQGFDMPVGVPTSCEVSAVAAHRRGDELMG